MTTITVTDLLTLFGSLFVVSLITNGSALAAVPDVRRTMVNDMGLISDVQFNSSIAIAQTAPGPSLLFVAVVGYQAAGLIGAGVTLLGMLLPSTTLAYAAARWGTARSESRLLRAFKAGMAPVVITFPLASGWLLAAQTPGWAPVALTTTAAVLVWLTRVHVLLLIAAGAALGALGVV
jgi:chromate transporter